MVFIIVKNNLIIKSKLFQTLKVELVGTYVTLKVKTQNQNYHKL